MSIVDLLIVGVFNLVILLIKVLLYPVDLLINTFIPSLGTAFSSIADFLDITFSYIGWAISVTGIPSIGIALIVAYWTFKLTLPIQVWFMKLALSWYRTLKP